MFVFQILMSVQQGNTTVAKPAVIQKVAISAIVTRDMNWTVIKVDVTL